MEVLRKDIQNYLDRYQYERAKIFGVSQSAIFYALQRLNISYKKTLFHPKVNWLSRLIFKLKIFQYEFVEKRPIVYVNESGFAVDTPRNYGYSLYRLTCCQL